MLVKAGIRAHVENMPREGNSHNLKWEKCEHQAITKLIQKDLISTIWLPPKDENEKVAEEVKELLSPSRLNMLSPKEQALTLIEKLPRNPWT